MELFASYEAQIGDCSPDVLTILCAAIFPPCPQDSSDGEAWDICKDFCNGALSTCSAVDFSDLINCDDQPTGDDEFCTIADGGKSQHPHPKSMTSEVSFTTPAGGVSDV